MSEELKKSTNPPQGDGSIWRNPAIVAGITAIVFATLVSLFASSHGIKLARLVRDPGAIYDFPSYIGFFSNIGVFLMVSTAAVTGFAAYMCVRLSRQGALILASTAVLSAMLTIDDVFMMHEKASRLGEVMIFAVYGVLGTAILLRLRNTPTGYDLRGLWVALCFLGLSVLSDAFKIAGPFEHWLEDFSKLAGFAAWLTFWTGFAAHSLTKP